MGPTAFLSLEGAGEGQARRRQHTVQLVVEHELVHVAHGYVGFDIAFHLVQTGQSLSKARLRADDVVLRWDSQRLDTVDGIAYAHMPLVAELGEGFFLEGGDLRLIHGELRLAFTGFRRAFTGLPARHQSPTQVDAPGPGNCAHDKTLIGHVPRCEQAGDGGVAAEGLQREARAATGGTHEPRDPLHRFREGVDALACAGFKEHGEHPPAQILVFFTHPPEVKRDGPASGPHFLRHGADEDVQHGAFALHGVVLVHKGFAKGVGETAAQALETAHAADVEFLGGGVVGVGEFHVGEFRAHAQGHVVPFAGHHVLPVVLSLEAARARGKDRILRFEHIELARADIEARSPGYMAVRGQEFRDHHAVDDDHAELFEDAAELLLHFVAGEDHGFAVAASRLALEASLCVFFELHAP